VSAAPRLAGRRALVTGSSSGLGQSTAERLAAEGAAVIVNYSSSREGAEETVSAIESAGGRALAIQADVGDEDSVESLFDQATEALGGPVDLLVCNAGRESPHRLVEMPLEDWRGVLDVNLTGPFLCSRRFARDLLHVEARGVIVMVTSVHEVIPWPSYSHYCASKGGLKLFAQSIARELAPHGIRVVSVAPGAILTPINQEMQDDPAIREATLEQIPWGRIGEPADVAGAVAWLASPEADYVVGTTLFVDGGMTLYPGADH
jgi:glucose 1-dehydrogenase